MARSRNDEYKALGILAAGIIAIYLVYLALGALLPLVGTTAAYGVVVIAILAILFISGVGIKRVLSLKMGYGFYMLGGTYGIKTVDKLSKMKGGFWEEFAMWGLTLGVGVATYALVRGRIKKSTYLVGLVSLVLMQMFVIPYVGYGLQFVRLPGISVSQGPLALPNFSVILTNPLQMAQFSLTTIFGFAGSVVYAIAYNSGSILYSLAGFISNPTSAGAAASGINNQIPGVAPVIPGIDMPLLAGIAALAILLIVHEFSHGILARRAKVKIKQIGILLFGFIPIGGFVEPDEKAIVKLKPAPQTYIFAAGISANFLFMIIFFLLTIFFVAFVIPHAYSNGVVVTSVSKGYPAYGIIPIGAAVTSWNGNPITNISQLATASVADTPNSIVTVKTDRGTFKLKAVTSPTNSSRGLIGVSLGIKPVLDTLWGQIAYFLFSLFSLSMLLNFLVAVVNLLPIPGFDGWRIYRINIKSARFVNTFGALMILLIIVNIIPWLFYA